MAQRGTLLKSEKVVSVCGATVYAWHGLGIGHALLLSFLAIPAVSHAGTFVPVWSRSPPRASAPGWVTGRAKRENGANAPKSVPEKVYLL